MSSNGWPNPIGNFAEVQAPCFDMIFPFSSCCDSILAAHLCRYLGDFFVARRSASESTRCCVVESSVAIF